MAVQYNDTTAIGDEFIVQSDTPLLGVQSISGYTDVLLGETGTRYFDKQFKFSANGVTYSSWIDLTNANLINTFVGEENIFDIQYKYTRAGTDTTGLLTFILITLNGTIDEPETPLIYNELYFNNFFNYNDAEVLSWALNVLNKVYDTGIVANYIERGEVGGDDSDFISFFGSLTHFFAILVRYMREYKNYNENEVLLRNYLTQRGLFVNTGMDLSELQTLLSNLYTTFLKRGTNQVSESDGELPRLLRKGTYDEYLFGLIESEKTIWNVDNNSPLWRGTKEAVNLIKAYETTKDVEVLANYPLISAGTITKYTDGTKEVIRVLNASVDSGIGDAKTNSKLILVDSRLSYEITFELKQPSLGTYISCSVIPYDKDENLLASGFISAKDGTTINTCVVKKSLLKNDIYYKERIILFNENIDYNSDRVPSVLDGNHLIFNNSDVKYISINLFTEPTGGYVGSNSLMIYDFKVRPLIHPIPNAFVMVPNIISSYLENNAEDVNVVIKDKIRRYLIPYNAILKNQFLDEIFVPAGTPLTMTIVFTNVTVYGADNGTITITAVGGVQPYNYSIDNGANYQTSNYFTELDPDTYPIKVLDSDGTTVTDTIVIVEGSSSLDFNLIVTECSRSNVLDGEITVLAFGGVAPYYYSLDNISYQAENLFKGLQIGSYTVYVRDSDTVPTTINKSIVMGAVRDKYIHYTVDDAHGHLAGANVNVISENYTTLFDGTTYFYLDSGNYSVTISKTQFRTYVDSLAVNLSAVFRTIVLQSVVYNITVHVTDGGVDVEKAIVTFNKISSSDDGAWSYTDSGGLAVFSELIVDTYTLTVVLPDERTNISSQLISTNNQTINILF